MTLPAPRRLSGASSEGAVYDHGAHLVSWAPTGAEPVLWLSEKTHLEADKPIRGGVPICFPWFGPGRSKDMQPAHGTARLATWALESLTEGDEPTITYTLTSDDVPDPQGSWRATYAVTAGAELTLSLTVENTGDQPFSFEEALHTYLTVGDVRQVSISGLDGAAYLDKAPGGADATQQGDITITGETDRVYSSTAEVVVTDPTLGRALSVSKEGSATTVVWNPWVDKAAAMPDFGDDEWAGMLCVETANALDDAVELAPGESHTMTARVGVTTL